MMSTPDGQMYFDDLPARSYSAVLTAEEIFSFADAAFMAGVHESSLIEKKSSRIQPKQLAEYLSMWANTTGGGLIAIGISDDGTLEGFVRQSPNHVNRLEQARADLCPDAHFKSKRLPFTHPSGEQDFVLLFYVQFHETKAVATAQGEYFVRIGDQRRKLKDDLEIRELRDSKGEVRAESELVSLDFPEDFNGRAISQFVETVRARDELSAELRPEEILSRHSLGKIRVGKFLPNLACALLFASVPREVAPGCRIRFLRFDGEEEGSGEKWNAVKDLYVDGSIPEQIIGIAQILKSQLRTFSRLGPGGKFFTAEEYPETAWYEAIVNACVHRTYSNGLRNATVFVKMFDDRLEILSPGSFMPFVSPSNIYTVLSVPRNPNLMNALRYLDLVKMAREGTRRMKATMGEMGLPVPEFRARPDVGTHVTVILRNKIKQRKAWVDSDIASVVGASLARLLSDQERRCLNFVAENGSTSVSDAQRLTSQSWPACKKLLDGLVSKGVLTHTHRTDLERDPKARYTLSDIQDAD